MRCYIALSLPQELDYQLLKKFQIILVIPKICAFKQTLQRYYITIGYAKIEMTSQFFISTRGIVNPSNDSIYVEFNNMSISLDSAQRSSCSWRGKVVPWEWVIPVVSRSFGRYHVSGPHVTPLPYTFITTRSGYGGYSAYITSRE